MVRTAAAGSDMHGEVRFCKMGCVGAVLQDADEKGKAEGSVEGNGAKEKTCHSPQERKGDNRGGGAVEEVAGGWDAIERERQEMRSLKLKNSPRNKMAVHNGPSRKRNCKRRTEFAEMTDGKICNVDPKMQIQHVPKGRAKKFVNKAREQRDVSKTVRNTAWKLSLDELRKKEENMRNFDKDLIVEEKSTTQTVNNREGDNRGGGAILSNGEKEAAVEEVAGGWDAIERERQEMRSLKLKNSPRNKMAVHNGSCRKRNCERRTDFAETTDGDICNVDPKMQIQHVPKGRANKFENVGREQMDVSMTVRKTVKKLSLDFLRKKEENMRNFNKDLIVEEKSTTQTVNNREMHHRKKGNSKRSNKRCLLHVTDTSDVDCLHSLNKAKTIQSRLDPALPTFVKPMKQSHVSGGFWLCLPAKFCQFLPAHDCIIILVDEEDQEFETVYLAKRTGLSGGWRGFSIAHRLVLGDSLVFQLVQPRKMKVYIIRGNSFGASHE